MKQYFECVQTLAIQVCSCVYVEVGGWRREVTSGLVAKNRL